jgi:L-aspartate oxidase
MDGVHPMGSLAPRDVVARAIDVALKETGDACVLLDLSPIPRPTIETRFPGILAECARRGIDIREASIPVVPAAHYACGGVRTDARARTSLPGLYAAGEVACTGVHGANRLASNSLLEAVVYSHRAAEQVPLALSRMKNPGVVRRPAPSVRDPGDARGHATAGTLNCRRDELRRVMWEDAGIVRSTSRLEHAAGSLGCMRLEVEAAHAKVLDPAVIELRNLTEVSALIVRSALLRRESRGLHYTLDYPYRDNERHLRDTVLTADGA